jgi:hypothetical protein
MSAELQAVVARLEAVAGKIERYQSGVRVRLLTRSPQRMLLSVWGTDTLLLPYSRLKQVMSAYWWVLASLAWQSAGVHEVDYEAYGCRLRGQ